MFAVSVSLSIICLIDSTSRLQRATLHLFLFVKIFIICFSTDIHLQFSLYIIFSLHGCTEIPEQRQVPPHFQFLSRDRGREYWICGRLSLKMFRSISHGGFLRKQLCPNEHLFYIFYYTFELSEILLIMIARIM